MEEMEKFEHLLNIKPEESFEWSIAGDGFYIFRLINDNIDRVMASSNLDNIMKKILGMEFVYGKSDQKYSLAEWILKKIEGIADKAPDEYNIRCYKDSKFIIWLILRVLKEKSMDEQAKSFILSLCDKVNKRASRYRKEVFSPTEYDWSNGTCMSQRQSNYEGSKVSVKTILGALRDIKMEECEKLFIDKLDSTIKMEMKDMFPQDNHPNMELDKSQEEKQAFISNIARAIQSKLGFKISGYGSEESKDIFRYLVTREKCGVDDYTCGELFAQRMKHDFGGGQITDVSEFIQLIRGIGRCDWRNYQETMDVLEEFKNYKSQKKYEEKIERICGCKIKNDPNLDLEFLRLMQLMEEKGYCDWHDYQKHREIEEEFKNYAQNKCEEKIERRYRSYVSALRRFWQRFLFCEASGINSVSDVDIQRLIEVGISDEGHLLQRDYQVVPDKIIRNADDLVAVMTAICSNCTYFYFEPQLLFQDIADRLTDSEVFKQITQEHLCTLLIIHKELLLNLSESDLDYTFQNYGYQFHSFNLRKLFKIIINILEQSNSAEIIQRIIQWFNSLNDDNRYSKFLYGAVRDSIEEKLFDHLVANNVQLKLNDVCPFFALYVKALSDRGSADLNPGVITKLFGQVFSCCSDDISQNESKLNLDLILNIKQAKYFRFLGDIPFATFVELLDTNRDKISFSDKFIKKMFSLKLETGRDSISLEKWVYINTYFYLNLKQDESDQTKKHLTSLKATINFMLKNSLTKDTEENGDKFLELLASIINEFENKSNVNKNTNKLIVDLVLTILRDNQMYHREKLFIDTLVPELRPGLLSDYMRNNHFEMTGINILNLAEQAYIKKRLITFWNFRENAGAEYKNSYEAVRTGGYFRDYVTNNNWGMEDVYNLLYQAHTNKYFFVFGNLVKLQDFLNAARASGHFCYYVCMLPIKDYKCWGKCNFSGFERFKVWIYRSLCWHFFEPEIDIQPIVAYKENQYNISIGTEQIIEQNHPKSEKTNEIDNGGNKGGIEGGK